jgi:hypothetical protein
VRLKDKTGTLVLAALSTLFQVRKPNTIQPDKGTEFFTTDVQPYLKREGVDFQTTHNPDIKSAVIERFNRTLKTRMYKYFTKFSTYRYEDTIRDLLGSYKYFHSTICMPPGKVSPTNIYSVWRKVNSLQAKILLGHVTFKGNDHARITKQKVVFAKGYEQTFSTEIFRVAKVIPRVPQPVYELRDLQNRCIEGQFYNYELVKVTITTETDFKINKIVRTSNKNGIKHFVKWKGYDKTYNSWVNAGEIKNI